VKRFLAKLKLSVASSVKHSFLILVVFTAGCNTQSFDKPAEVAVYGQKVTYNNQVDVLWVIDPTSQMGSKQQALASQVGMFVDSFNQTGLDYQMAVTTMDMSGNGEKGAFVSQSGTPAILKKDTPNLVATLAGRIFVGEYDWQPLTRAQEAVKAALSNPTLVNGINAGFLRPNALLVMIFLSSGNDHSAPFNYKGWLDQLRPPLAYGDRSWVAQFMGVMPNDSTCKTAAWGYSEPGMAYIDLASYSGGAAESICDGDMRRALTNVKSRVLEMITAYPLPATVISSSIKVVINGQTVAKDPTNGWTYDATTNSVRFHGTAIPRPDATISVTFDRNGL
jgi:hypothetical protein